MYACAFVENQANRPNQGWGGGGGAGLNGTFHLSSSQATEIGNEMVKVIRMKSLIFD